MAKEKDKKYIVAPGFSFTGNKKMYAAGDEIDAEAFGNPKDFQKYLSTKPPRIIEGTPEKPAKNTANESGGKGGNTDAADERKKLEEAVISNGLGKAEELAALSDDDLKSLLKSSGVE